MRTKISIRCHGSAWRLTIPGFGFNADTVKEFTRWPQAIDYLNTRPGAGFGSCERAPDASDGIAVKPAWSPLQWW